MKLSNFTKSLIMAVIGFVAATVSDMESINFTYIGISTLGFTIIYLGKNYVLPSSSDPGVIDWQDLFSGVVVAVGMAVSSFAASIITIGYVDWKQLIIAVGGAVLGYFAKTLPQKSK